MDERSVYSVHFARELRECTRGERLSNKEKRISVDYETGLEAGFYFNNVSSYILLSELTRTNSLDMQTTDDSICLLKSTNWRVLFVQILFRHW